MIILFVVVLLIGALGLASQLGWSVDSRDGADWRSTDGGVRASGWTAQR